MPRSAASLTILGRIEHRYGLAQGYFKAKLPHQSRALYGHHLDDVSPAERRRLAWHLPDDFGSLPFSKREEILEWVRRVIISGSTDYRRFQAAATKQRYAINRVLRVNISRHVTQADKGCDFDFLERQFGGATAEPSIF